MKISKAVLQAVAVAVTISTLAACADGLIKPKGEKESKNKVIDNCPACGMG
jgi:predicted small lipoprotein YifL